MLVYKVVKSPFPEAPDAQSQIKARPAQFENACYRDTSLTQGSGLAYATHTPQN